MWLLFGARLTCQAIRLNLGGLMPLLAEELSLSTTQKGWLLSAFPFGYLLTQVIGGIVVDRVGGKPVMSVALLSTAVGIFACASLESVETMCLVMFLMGMLQGPSFPTNGVMLARWVPASERAFATAVADAGGPLGAVVALVATPVLGAGLGWRMAMLISGVVMFAFWLLWTVLAASSPSTCNYVSSTEMSELRKLGVVSDAKEKGGPPRLFPWKILSIPSVWSVLLAPMAFNFMRYLLYNWIITFHTDRFGVSLAVAAASMLWPNVTDAVCSIFVGRIADAVTSSGAVSTLTVRRFCTSVGFIGTGVNAVLIGEATDMATATIFVTLASASQAFHNAGFKSTYGDLSREYCGVISGLGNMVATGSSFAVPLIAAYVIEAHGGSTEAAAWQALFKVLFVCGMLGTICYVSLVSTEKVDAQLAKEKSS